MIRWTRRLTSSTRLCARTLSHAPASSQKQNACRRPSPQRATDHPGDFPGLVDVASNHQYMAVIKAPGDGPDQWRVRLLVVGPRHPHALHARIGSEVVRQARDVAGKPVSLRIEDAGEMDAAGILPKMIVERERR